jgi:hypothetical protein
MPVTPSIAMAMQYAMVIQMARSPKTSLAGALQMIQIQTLELFFRSLFGGVGRLGQPSA